VDAGIHVAATSDLVFAKTSEVGSSCLAWSGGRLLTCARDAVAGFSIGASDDLGVHFTPVMRLSSIEPRTCPAGTSASVCAQTWPAIAASLRSDGGLPNGLNPVESEALPAPANCRCDFRAPRRKSLASLFALAGLARRRRRRPRRVARHAKARTEES
jgi:hypothetical protein